MPPPLLPPLLRPKLVPATIVSWLFNAIDPFGEDKIQMLSSHNEGDQVEVSFNLSSNEYNGKYYSNIDAWRIESLAAASPNTTVIPAGLWDFNIWADATSTVTNQMILKLDVYKYDGSNVPTLLASSGDIYIYDPVATAQYIASVVFPQTTLLTTDRIYIELRAKGTQNNKNVTIYFGGTTPTHVHTTFPSVGGSGLLNQSSQDVRDTAANANTNSFFIFW